MSQIPILFYGDSPSMQTGLARIGRDLALGVSRLPQYRVAFLGRGDGTGAGIADSRLPFLQYTFDPRPRDQWGVRVLPDVWENFSRGERGVIFTIWDPSRLTWFGYPLDMGEGGEERKLLAMLQGQPPHAPFERWGYFAVDAAGSGEGGSLPPLLAKTLAGYDEIVAYSKFGKTVIDATLGRGIALRGSDWMPHGFTGAAFQPRDRETARRDFGLLPGQRLVGCVMTNQERKDFGLWAQMARLVANSDPSIRFWVHTDSLDRHWDLNMLLDQFDLWRLVKITLDHPSDVEMSWRYSACDLTVLPSLGEGFGYPIVESQACGVPVVHGAYAAGAEWIPDGALLVHPESYRIDTRWCLQRPVYLPNTWANRVLDVLRSDPSKQPPSKLELNAVAHLEWHNLWPCVWQPWFEARAAEFAARYGEGAGATGGAE